MDIGTTNPLIPSLKIETLIANRDKVTRFGGANTGQRAA